jgi:hypothetical protein
MGTPRTLRSTTRLPAIIDPRSGDINGRPPASVDTHLPARIDHAIERAASLPALTSSAHLDENCAIDRDAWASIVASAASTRLPDGALNETQAIEFADTEIFSRVRHWWEPDFGLEMIKAALRRGLPSFIDRTIEAAEAGNEMADMALRNVFVEISRGELRERWPGQYLRIKMYGEDAVLRAPNTRRRGVQLPDDFFETIQTVNLTIAICLVFGINPERNQLRPDLKRAPSGISITVAVLARHGIPRTEIDMQRNTWGSPNGKLARSIAIALFPTGNYIYEATGLPREHQRNSARRRLLKGAALDT